MEFGGPRGKTLGKGGASRVNRESADGRPLGIIEVEGALFEALLDTGAGISVISEDVWEKMNQPRLEKSIIRVQGAFGHDGEQCMGKVSVILKWGSDSKQVELCVFKQIRPNFIIGVDILKQFGMELKKVMILNSKIINLEDTTREEKHQEIMKYLKIQRNSKLEKIVEENNEIFMLSKFDIGCTEILEHQINTTGKPIMQNPRRQPIHLENKVDELIEKLEEAGIIEKCQSQWNTPMVITQKKDGDIRMCLDFRKLNDISTKPSFPIPHVQSLLDALTGSKIFSTLDLGNAFYQVKLTRDSREKTAFSTRRGQFCFTRMPFGIAAAPFTFQKLMHTILEGLLWKGVLVYLDDIIIYAETKEEHDSLIQEVFRRIALAKVKINPEKCIIDADSLKFLGFEVTSSGIKSIPEKVQAMTEFETPKCKKQLKTFLGLTGYYRRFIKNYAEVTKPLNSAINGEDSHLEWTTACEKSFNDLKTMLTSAPILKYPDIDKPFILDTDACFNSVGSVLSQMENGLERPVAFSSRLLSAHEKGYCVTRKELLAICVAVEHFKPYLYGKQFLIRTDHKALEFLGSSSKAISPQFQTWMDLLSSFNFKIEFRRGIDHGNADGMSRSMHKLCAQCQTKHENAIQEKPKIRFLNAINLKENVERYWIKEQMKDEEIQTIINLLDSDIRLENDSDVKTNKLFRKINKLKLVRGILCIEDDKEEKIIVPEKIEEETIKRIHEEMCHIGSDKTVEMIKKNLYFENINRKTIDIISKCIACQKAKTYTGKTKEKPIEINTSRPFEIILIDVAYIETNSGKTKFVIGIIDHFSKLVSLTVTNKQDEQSVARTILQNWIYRYGTPETIITDKGRSFEGRVFSKLCNDLGIRKESTSPYCHQTTGLIERQFRTIRELCRAMRNGGDVRSMELLIPKIEFTINSTKQATTKLSPFQIIYEGAQRKFKAVTNYLEQEEIQRTNREFKKGERVLVRIPSATRKGKRDNIFEGPYEIKEIISPRRVLLMRGGAKPIERRIEWLRKIEEGRSCNETNPQDDSMHTSSLLDCISH